MAQHLTIFDNKLTHVTKDIYCRTSGVLLGHIQVAIVEGHMTYLQSHAESVFLHPFYGLDSVVLMKKLESSLHAHQESGWTPSEAEKLRLRLLCSAVMHHLGVLKQSEPTLPSHVIASASAGRLLGICKWFWFTSSQRLQLPQYSVSKKNENLEWQNFKFWLDGAYEVRHEWTSTSREMKRDAEKKLMEQAMSMLRSEHIRPVDKKKVWNWIALQLEGGKVHQSRIDLWKELFLTGDTNITDWHKDDVEDLQFAIAQHCDTAHEILFYVNQRLNGIKSMIQDFFGSFTLLTTVQKDHYGEEGETEEEKQFFAGFDKQAEALEELPGAPKREDFATLGLFIQAQARWNILKKRWDQMQLGKTAEPSGVVESQLGDL